MTLEIDLPLGANADSDAHAERLAADLTEVGNERFLRAVLRDRARFHHRSTTALFGPPSSRPEVAEPDASLLLRAIHLCFSAHLPLSLSPDVLWYAVVHEVAVHVQLNTDAYAGLFTATPGERQAIVVHDDFAPLDWERSVNLVQQPLRERIGEEIADLFQPTFSTTTPATATATLIALLDVVSPYYRFRWSTLCGIPRIRLEGTDRDWRLLVSQVRELAGWFEGLAPWFAALEPVLVTIADTASGWGVDEEFWRSLYSWRSESGGDRVTGWITAFFAHRYTEDGPIPKDSFGADGTDNDDFPSHVSRVPFRWQTPAGTSDMAFLGGVLGIERDGEWIRPHLGHAVVELLHTEPRDERLPEPWTLAAVQRVTGCPTAHLLDTMGTVRLNGEELEAAVAINVNGLCVVRGADGNWHLGDLVSEQSDIHCWGTHGPDLGTALRSL
ncbi:DUF4419 domain-containing protein [Kitasatospora sp. NPDC052896]|uniref:DUF4419 domain-containing protein n=1 Tax=Kitasatospora sp. NPDC052896 TaxID=3364061 RepID=UPI0037C9C595